MAQKIELIIGILEEMRQANVGNSESFANLLDNVVNKLDIVDSNKSSIEFVKTYLNELVKTFDSKYSKILANILEIENGLKSIFNEHAQNDDQVEFYKNFSKNMDTFHFEAEQQRVLLVDIEARLEALVSETCEAPTELITSFKEEIVSLYNRYLQSLEKANLEIKSIFEYMLDSSFDELSDSGIDEDLEVITTQLREVLAQLSSAYDKEDSLQKLFGSVVTTEDLKNTQTFVDTIITRTKEIVSKVSSYVTTNEVGDLGLEKQGSDEVSKVVLKKLISALESIMLKTDEVKKNLAQITKDIETIPNTEVLKSSLQDVFSQLEILSEDISKVALKSNVGEVDNKLSLISDELYVIKNIVIDLQSVLSEKVMSAIDDISFEQETNDIKDSVSKMLENLPQKEDIEKLFKNYEVLKTSQDGIKEVVEGLAQKQDVDNLATKIDEVAEKVGNLKFEDEFDRLYSNTANLEKWIEKSKLIENVDEIKSEISLKADEKDVLDILKVTDSIVGRLDKFASKFEEGDYSNEISNIVQSLEDLKVELNSNIDINNASVVKRLSELQATLDNIVSVEDFSNFVEDLRTFVEKVDVELVSSKEKIDDVKNYQKNIIEKLEKFDFSNVEENLITISEYLNSTSSINLQEVQQVISEIREIFLNKKSNLDDIAKNNMQLSEDISEFIQELKTLLDTSDTKLTGEVEARIAKIETLITSSNSNLEESYEQVIKKLDECLEKTSALLNDNQVQGAIDEISTVKSQIVELSESFRALCFKQESKEKEISNFVSEQLENLGSNIGDLVSSLETQVQAGFTYNAELVDEKSSALLEIIKELRHSNSQNIELYERLTVTDNKLLDCKQELELINTDVVSNLNNATDLLINEIRPLKNLVANALNLSKSNIASAELKSNMENLHNSVQEDLEECTKYSPSTLNKMEDAYAQISKALMNTENNLRDFILGDIDSVIIKIDNLKTDLDINLKRIVPPSAEDMAEFKNFVQGIEDFKKSQQQAIEKAVERINEKLATQHEELKAMLAVSINNQEIINAIDELKDCFRGRIKELNEIQDKEFDEEFQKDSAPEFANNEYEKAFEADNSQVIEEIKSDFDKFGALLKELTEGNPEIEQVLSEIKSKMENITVVSTRNDDVEIFEPEGENNEVDEVSEDNAKIIVEDTETLIGKGKFDFFKALDCLKQDIKNVHSEVEKFIPKDEQIKASSSLKIPVLSGENLLFSLNNKVERLLQSLKPEKWLEEIKTYIDSENIQTMLEEISGKIDILTLSDNTEWLVEIKSAIDQLNNSDVTENVSPEIQAMLSTINAKIDVIASTDDYELVEEVRDALEDYAKNDALIKTINEKIDIIASSDNTSDFEELNYTLEEIREKLEAIPTSIDLSQFKVIESLLEVISDKLDNPILPDDSSKFVDLEKLLETISAKLDNPAIPEEFLSIKQNIAKIEKSISKKNNDEEIAYFEDIKESLESIESKIDSSSAYETSNNIEDIKYTLLNVEEKVDNVSKLSDADAKITLMLESLNHKIDTISDEGNTSTQKGFQDVKDLIMAQMDYLESLERNEKTEALKKCLKELTIEVNNINIKDSTKQIQKTIREMKESIMVAVVTIFEQVSFIEETEEIKDFVEEKTDEINQNLVEVTNQLRQITNANEAPDYNYSMQDIESDLAKLRLALNDLQTHEQENQAVKLTSILENINQIGASFEDLQNSLTKEEVFGLRLKFDRINTDIKSLNALTNQLIVKSSETYNAINTTFEDFGRVITDQLSKKVDTMTSMLEESKTSDKVMRQALIYMGEWIDSASESMNKISSNSEEIVDIKSAINGLKKVVPEQTEILNSIEEKFDEQQERLSYFEKQISKISGIEDRFDEQQERIDRLEMALEKILSAVEDIDDSKVTRKIDKIDKQIAKLSTNIEKLASYVD